MGTIDTPAFVDYILKYTKKEQLILYGHSLGGAVLVVFLSERPEYNDKVSSIHLLAPGIKAKFFENSLAPYSHQLAVIVIAFRHCILHFMGKIFHFFIPKEHENRFL